MYNNFGSEGAAGASNSSSSSSYFDTGFDYRSLLPTTRSSSNTEQQLLPPVDDTGDGLWCCGLQQLPALTWRERCIGCATCMMAGYLLSMGSFWRIADLMRGHPLPFVVNATVGNVIALAGSCFFTGPATQVRKMCHEKRRIATTLYLGSLCLTLIVAFAPLPGPKGFVLLLLMLAQYVAVAWYCLSYIPFAHEAVSSYLQRYWQGNDY
jgi:Got1/Sft2-like family